MALLRRDRQFTHDFLYQLDWQDVLKDGALTRIDVAFSRDTPDKLYVQHRIWKRRRDLIGWLDNGANFYVCGDANVMAKDVRKTLVAGDVNRNVMCNPNPYQSRAHAAALGLARAISDHLEPRTPAYREIWLAGSGST